MYFLEYLNTFKNIKKKTHIFNNVHARNDDEKALFEKKRVGAAKSLDCVFFFFF